MALLNYGKMINIVPLLQSVVLQNMVVSFQERQKVTTSAVTYEMMSRMGL